MTKPIISIIVAIAQNRAIGKDGNLIWHLSADLKHFKSVTMGKTVIMGYNTYLSLPQHKALPGRRNIIISSRLNEAPDGFELVHSIPEALKHVEDHEEVFIMGGGSIYEQMLPLADRLYITRIEKSYEADTYFPFVNYDEWNLIDLTVIDDDPQIDCSYRFELWERRIDSVE